MPSNATDVLRQEHALIHDALLLLAAGADLAETGAPPPSRELRALVDFFVDFVDGVHHGKEEKILLPRLDAVDGDVVHALLADHEHGRELVQAMRAALHPFDGAAFACAAREYVACLRCHIVHEERWLFDAADRLFDRRRDRQVRSAFERLDGERGGTVHHRVRIRELRHKAARRFWRTVEAASGVSRTRQKQLR